MYVYMCVRACVHTLGEKTKKPKKTKKKPKKKNPHKTNKQQNLGVIVCIK